MNDTTNNGGPAFPHCSRCGENAVRTQGHQWLCAKHYRFGQMRQKARASGKEVPSHAELLEALKAVTSTEMFLPDHPQRQAAYKAARAAIAKATQ